MILRAITTRDATLRLHRTFLVAFNAVARKQRRAIFRSRAASIFPIKAFLVIGCLLYIRLESLLDPRANISNALARVSQNLISQLRKKKTEVETRSHCQVDFSPFLHELYLSEKYHQRTAFVLQR